MNNLTNLTRQQLLDRVQALTTPRDELTCTVKPGHEAEVAALYKELSIRPVVSAPKKPTRNEAAQKVERAIALLQEALALTHRN